MKKINKQIRKYTAFIPRTVKATKNIGKNTIKKTKYLLRIGSKSIKNTTKMINKSTAKTIRSFKNKF